MHAFPNIPIATLLISTFLRNVNQKLRICHHLTIDSDSQDMFVLESGYGIVTKIDWHNIYKIVC